MNDVAGLGPLLPTHWLSWLEVFHPTEPYRLDPTTNGGECGCQVFGVVTDAAALVPYCSGLLLLQRITCPQLGAVHAEAFHQCRHAACAVTGQAPLG